MSVSGITARAGMVVVPFAFATNFELDFGCDCDSYPPFTHLFVTVRKPRPCMHVLHPFIHIHVLRMSTSLRVCNKWPTNILSTRFGFIKYINVIYFTHEFHLPIIFLIHGPFISAPAKPNQL